MDWGDGTTAPSNVASRNNSRTGSVRRSRLAAASAGRGRDSVGHVNHVGRPTSFGCSFPPQLCTAGRNLWRSAVERAVGSSPALLTDCTTCTQRLATTTFDFSDFRLRLRRETCGVAAQLERHLAASDRSRFLDASALEAAVAGGVSAGRRAGVRCRRAGSGVREVACDACGSTHVGQIRAPGTVGADVAAKSVDEKLPFARWLCRAGAIVGAPSGASWSVGAPCGLKARVGEPEAGCAGARCRRRARPRGRPRAGACRRRRGRRGSTRGRGLPRP
jgi:hypothetical protein